MTVAWLEKVLSLRESFISSLFSFSIRRYFTKPLPLNVSEWPSGMRKRDIIIERCAYDSIKAKIIKFLTRAFASFTLRTHTAVHGVCGISHTVHAFWTGVVFTQDVQRGTFATWLYKKLQLRMGTLMQHDNIKVCVFLRVFEVWLVYRHTGRWQFSGVAGWQSWGGLCCRWTWHFYLRRWPHRRSETGSPDPHTASEPLALCAPPSSPRSHPQRSSVCGKRPENKLNRKQLDKWSARCFLSVQ